MTTFVLVHGAWHGGWSWSRVVQQLRLAGHRAVAGDLPCDRTNAGWAEYASAVMDEVGTNRDDVVVVGHSLGGGVIPLIATGLSAKRMVFVGSFPPEPAKSLNDAVGEDPDLTDPKAAVFKDSLDEEGRYVWPDFESARYAMYDDCSLEDARWAFGLLRPQATKPFTDIWPLTAWPDIPMTFVVCSEDRMGSALSLTRLAQRRFGVEAVRLAGGHSPFLSRPRELVSLLLNN